MGNQTSSQNEDHKKKKDSNVNFLGNKIDSSGIITKGNNSSYRGIKTETNSVESSQAILKENTTEASSIVTTDKIETKDMKIPTTFEWKESGGTVYVTGSFSHWSQLFLMNKVGNHFELTLVIF